MLFNTLPLTLVLLITSAAPSDASLFSRGISRTFERAHRVAIKHSHGLARDLRVAFNAILVEQPESGTRNHAVYCTANAQGSSTLGGGSSIGGSGNGTSRSSSTRGPGSATGTATSAGAAPTISASIWKLTESHSGNNFFDGWNFFTQADPTNGNVQFVDQNTATTNNLLEVNSAGNAVMRVETTPTVASNRQSIRIQTQSAFNGGLVIMDSVHMPQGCATWPAFWTNGPTWPATGEIDIIEGVNDYTNNQATIHTNPGCTLASSSSSALSITGSIVGGTDCSALDTGNQGCGIRASTNNSYGSGFNSIGGGVYAMQWDTTGIAIYFFPSGTTPPDITAEAPQPTTWGEPMARWPASTCNPSQFFNSHSVIFDTTLCGDWAGGVWTSSGIPGQEQSCAQRTGFSTCEAFVQASGASFNDAYWEIRSVKIYQQNQ